jgi:hypothetical protein
MADQAHVQMHRRVQEEWLEMELVSHFGLQEPENVQRQKVGLLHSTFQWDTKEERVLLQEHLRLWEQEQSVVLFLQ